MLAFIMNGGIPSVKTVTCDVRDVAPGAPAGRTRARAYPVRLRPDGQRPRRQSRGGCCGLCGSGPASMIASSEECRQPTPKPIPTCPQVLVCRRGVWWRVPVSVVGNIDIDGLDPRTRAAVERIGFGQATKLHLTVQNSCAPGIRQELNTPFSTWATAGVGMDEAAFVTGFGATHDTQRKLAVADGPRVFRPLAGGSVARCGVR